MNRLRWIPPLLLAFALGGFRSGSRAAEPAPAPATPAWVWIEAETPPGESDAELSGGQMAWIGPGGAVRRPVFIPSAGTYHLWVRKFWNPQPFRWRVGTNAPWQESREQRLTDLIQLGGNPGRRVGWTDAGTVQLPAGPQMFALEIPADAKGTTAYDCFLLTAAPFTPHGALKPGEKVSLHEPGWFAFQPDPDPAGGTAPRSPIDLRSLNERFAGELGRIRTRGEDFVHERTGEPVRFWAVNVGMDFVGSTPGEMATLARTLARRGVNLVRVHGPIYETQGANFGRPDARRITQLQAFVQALKRDGIYTSLSIYFPLWVRLDAANTRFPGYTGKNPFGLLYFNPDYQALYRTWWRDLLTTPDPVTGGALKDEPAVAFAELVNEDSTLFWTFNPDAGAKGNLPDPQRALLEKQFGDWLLARYPGRTLAEIRTTEWNELATPHDDFAAGRVGFRGLWQVFHERTRRDQEAVAFLTGLMRSFHQASYRHLKQDLGFGGLVYGSNWKTASDQYLDPLDKYANGVADFYDRHGYFGGPHDGPNAAWNLEPNQTYDDRSALLFHRPDGTGDDFANPVFDVAYGHQPSVITELNWPLPNRYRADMVLVGAAYGALQGSDGLFWFAAGSPDWDGLPGKFSIQTPVVQGQFPGAALIFRQGLVRTAPRVVDLQLTVADLHELKGTPLPTPQNFDQLRNADVPAGGTLTNTAVIDSLAFAVGRVGVDFVESGRPVSRVTDLSPFIDRTRKRVRSQTGELEWDWGTGRVTVNAPAAQAVTGFLGTAGRVDLADVAFESPLEYGTLLLVSLDGRPLASSARMLLQVATEERPHEWATDRPTGVRKITHRGALPLMVREAAGTVRLKRADAAAFTVTPLDFNGQPQGPVSVGAASIALRPETPYYLIAHEGR